MHLKLKYYNDNTFFRYSLKEFSPPSRCHDEQRNSKLQSNLIRISAWSNLRLRLRWCQHTSHSCDNLGCTTAGNSENNSVRIILKMPATKNEILLFKRKIHNNRQMIAEVNIRRAIGIGL